jgi:L-galactose dehydrogenase
MNPSSADSTIPIHVLARSGLRLPALGFGAATLGGAYGTVDMSAARAAIAAGLAAGMHYFDTSPFYGKTRSESILGECLKGVPRDRYVMATKVGRYGTHDFDFSAARVRASVEESLQRLNCEYLDLIQCHDIEFCSLRQIINEAIPVLQELKKIGKVRAIGITGYPLKVFREVLAKTDIDTMLSYCRCNLLDQTLCAEMPWLAARRIDIINGSPLSMGLLSSKGPPPWHPAPAALRAGCQQAAALCAAAGEELGDLALQIAVAMPGVASTLVGISSAVEVERNLALMAKPIDQNLLKDVQAILAPHYNQPWQSGLPENN